jgi:hypothetical protein
MPIGVAISPTQMKISNIFLGTQATWAKKCLSCDGLASMNMITFGCAHEHGEGIIQ